jgi:hypothetical protein
MCLQGVKPEWGKKNLMQAIIFPLGSLTIVIVNNTTQHITTANWPGGHVICLREEDLLFNTMMRA